MYEYEYLIFSDKSIVKKGKHGTEPKRSCKGRGAYPVMMQIRGYMPLTKYSPDEIQNKVFALPPVFFCPRGKELKRESTIFFVPFGDKSAPAENYFYPLPAFTTLN